jgi:photosystem II stability/assembly factor-like uncharacterized protein
LEMGHYLMRERSVRTCLAAVMVVLTGLAVVLLLDGCGSGSGGAAAPTSSVAASKWAKQNTAAAGSGGTLSSVAFADSSHGWAVGAFAHGAILATTDGGATWTAQDASDAGFGVQLWSVCSVDASRAWAVGVDTDKYGSPTAPVIVATSDGGATWKAQDAISAGSSTQLRSVTFADAMHGWAAGVQGEDSSTASVPIILATSDGGTTWKKQDASEAGSGAALLSVAFTDARHGWAVGSARGSSGKDSPLILATSDGGSTWQAQDASAAGTNTTIYCVTFVDQSHGWAVGGTRLVSSSGDMIPLILATLDGGVTWRGQGPNEGSTGDIFYGVAFADRGHGWAVGCNIAKVNSGGHPTPVIFATSDGGRSWGEQDASAAGSGTILASVATADVAHAWSAGAVETDVFQPVVVAAGD